MEVKLFAKITDYIVKEEDVMLTLSKIFISKLLWKIAGVSPEWGNMVMDILGIDLYRKVMWYQEQEIVRKDYIEK